MARPTEREKLTLLLKGRGLSIVDITPGPEAHTQSADQLARAIRKSIIAVMRGECRDVDLSY